MTPWAREDESDLEDLLADGNRYRRRLNQEHHENLVGCAFFDLLAPQYGLERVPEAVTKSVGKRHGEACRERLEALQEAKNNGTKKHRAGYFRNSK